MKFVSVTGRRWFSRTHGNTYFSANIMVDGKLVHTIPYSYGYGGMYLQESTEWLDKNGYLPGLTHYSNGLNEGLWRYCMDRDITLDYSAVDVKRKRDL